MTDRQELQSYIDAGKFWRAREVLQGRISNAGYDAELYEQLGVVLLRMHDPLAAGKYLFLSGVRKPEYDEAIQIFLGRHAKAGASQFMSALPKSIRKVHFDAFPEAVASDLVARGFQKSDLDALAKQMAGGSKPSGGFSGKIGVAVFMALLFGLLISALRGLFWFFELISGLGG